MTTQKYKKIYCYVILHTEIAPIAGLLDFIPGPIRIPHSALSRGSTRASEIRGTTPKRFGEVCPLIELLSNQQHHSSRITDGNL